MLKDQIIASFTSVVIIDEDVLFAVREGDDIC